MQTLPLTRDLVLVGGGHTHALILKRWGMQPLPGARLTVIDPGPTAAYSGMLPGFVAGHYDKDDLGIDLVRLADFANARLILGAASGIDLAVRTITVAGRPPIAYDVASIDIGITSGMPDLPGFAEHGIPAKPLAPFAKRWADYRDSTTAPQIAVIGGGVAGAELAMAMAFALKGRQAQISLIDAGTVLSATTPTGRKLILDHLADLGIMVVENAQVTTVTASTVTFADGREIGSTFTVGAAGAQAHGWTRDIGLSLTDGFIAVDPMLRTSDPFVFAAGDCAHMTASPRPKAGVFAVRQAPVLFDNLRAALSGTELRPYTPQQDYLKLVSLGGKQAIAEKWGTARKGALLWKWKDRIDRSFMDKFRDLPVMALPALPLTTVLGVKEAIGTEPLCAGCGAKVGRSALAGGLSAITATRPDVDHTPGDDAAILSVGGQRQVITTDHLRAVTRDPVLMTRIAAIHALGDIWAMGATPQAALLTLILPRMSPDLQARTLAEITATAQEVMAEAGAAIAGGHTSQGDEMTIGFTLTGLCDRDPITIKGALPGDVLIMTKPIGSGTILAAAMRGLASGEVAVNCHATMVQSQATAAQILRQAHAMTDVTGFGLAGHLAGICAASNVAATLDLSAIPVMDGAEALSAQGIRSSLWTANRGDCGPVFGADGPRGALLFDPQTCGGLLAAIATDQADETLRKLLAAGYPAAIIGQIGTGDPVITLR